MTIRPGMKVRIVGDALWVVHTTNKRDVCFRPDGRATNLGIKSFPKDLFFYLHRTELRQ